MTGRRQVANAALGPAEESVHVGPNPLGAGWSGHMR
jgi:hypothetical protein